MAELKTFYVFNDYGTPIVTPSPEFWLEPEVNAQLLAEIQAPDYAHAVAEWDAYDQARAAKEAK